MADNPTQNTQNKDALMRLMVPTAFIAAGIGAVTWGLRPKTKREKRAEQVSTWTPPKQSMTKTQKSGVEQLRVELNRVRDRVRALWADPSALPRLSVVVGAADYAAALQNDQYPWPAQKIGVGTLQVDNKAGKFSTDVIAPRLQSAYSTADVALHAAGIMNLPVQSAAGDVAKRLRTLKDGHLLMLATTCAMQRGTFVKVIVNKNYETAMAIDEEKQTKHELYGSSALTWIALNTPVSDLNAEERKARREMRQRPYRVPRTLKP